MATQPTGTTTRRPHRSPAGGSGRGRHHRGATNQTLEWDSPEIVKGSVMPLPVVQR
jgi:hypothetical protein